MNQASIVAALVVGVTVIVGGLVWSSGKEKRSGEENKQVVGMAMAATVTIDQAIKTALENFPGKIIEAELEKEHGKTVWKVEIVTAEQQIMVVQIDAESGSVIDTAEKIEGRDRNASASRI